MWASVNPSRDPLEIMLFLRAYPESARAPAARQLMIEVMTEVEGATEAPEAVAEAGIVAEAGAEPWPNQCRTSAGGRGAGHGRAGCG